MKRSKKAELIIVVFITFIFVCSLTASEVRWAKLNDPNGKFSNISSYLAHGRLPSRVSKVVNGGKTFYITFSPIDDMWFALPSGPAAYVFDETGKMVHWSSDIGDDTQFQRQWLKSENVSTIKGLKQLELQ